MPKRKEPELDPKEQWKRFKDAAKKASVSTQDAEKAFKKVSPPARAKASRIQD
jgi:hypothetical protein